MATDTWLPLTEYSTKYKVSVSTLRRRIKAEDIRFRFEDGKYFILDETPNAHQREHRPSLNDDALMGASAPPVGAAAYPQHMSPSIDENVLAAANRLLVDLKKAYTQILQEKEEQILALKREVADLKTLTRVLEGENSRLQNR